MWYQICTIHVLKQMRWLCAIQLKNRKNEEFCEKIQFSPKIHVFSQKWVSELRKHLKDSPDLISYPPIITSHHFRVEFMKSWFFEKIHFWSQNCLPLVRIQRVIPALWQLHKARGFTFNFGALDMAFLYHKLAFPRLALSGTAPKNFHGSCCSSHVDSPSRMWLFS